MCSFHFQGIISLSRVLSFSISCFLKNQNMRIPWKSNEHGIAFISCISYISCITGVQDRGSLIQTWYSLQTHRLDLFLLFVQRSVMKQLCGVTKWKAQLGLSNSHVVCSFTSML